MILPQKSIIAAGPVIIENGTVLLDREKKEYGISPWFFSGGQVESFDVNLEESCKREVKEEMGIDIEIIRPLRTLLVKRSDGESYAILVHYLAKRVGDIQSGTEIAEWRWHDIHHLPDNCAPNVREIISDILNIVPPQRDPACGGKNS